MTNIEQAIKPHGVDCRVCGIDRWPERRPDAAHSEDIETVARWDEAFDLSLRRGDQAHDEDGAYQLLAPHVGVLVVDDVEAGCLTVGAHLPIPGRQRFSDL